MHRAGGMLSVNETTSIKDRPASLERVDVCMLCSREGVSLYKDVVDNTFGSPGSWNHLYCACCGLLWLSPRPLKSDMGVFYRTYLTHVDKTDHVRARNVNEKFKLALSARCLAKPNLARNWFWRQVARIASIDPFIREFGRIDTMYLGTREPGRMLDVGCGNGSFLALMQAAGWEVAGLETDPKAARMASDRLGITVSQLELKEANYSDGWFDAITLKHVIEHVYNPVELLNECRRILKPDGILVMVTPNIASSGHRKFKSDWRGLEPPRHLHLFTREALSSCARRAGIRVKSIRTSERMAPGMWLESQAILRRRAGLAAIEGSLLGSLLFLFRERAEKLIRPESGEELVFVGTPDLSA